jgi:hypothetical protein
MPTNAAAKLKEERGARQVHRFNLRGIDLEKRTPLGGTRSSVVPLICNLPGFD